MKNIFRKNQVIITALALMIAVVGYLNFTDDKVAKKDNKDTYVEADSNSTSYDDTNVDTDSLVNSADVASDDLLANLGEEDQSEEAAATEATSEDADTSDLLDSEEATTTDISDEDNLAASEDSIEVADNGEVKAEVEKENKDSKDTTGEAVLVNNNISSSFFSSAKLKREQTRAKIKESYMDVMDDKNASDEQKKKAIDSIIDLNAVADQENITETLIEAKGFKGVIVLISEGSVEVIVEASNMSDQQVAQIESIVKTKTGVPVQDITITPVKVN